MPELETVFVRIEADLSDFKRGLREAGRETRAFANEVNRAFADVGTALDLSPFRRELTETKRAAKRVAERMSKAFAEVGKAQEQAILKALKNFSQRPGAPTPVPPQGSGQPAVGTSDSTSKSLADEIANRFFQGLAAGLFALKATGGPAGGTQHPVTLAVKTVIITGATLAGAFAPELLESLLEALNIPAKGKRSVEEISEDLEFKRKLAEEDLRVFEKMGLNEKNFPLIKETLDELARLEGELAEAIRHATEQVALDFFDFENEVAKQSGAQPSEDITELLTTFTELSDCLRQLCARIDELSSAPSGAADGIGFEGSQAGGQFTLASFAGAAPFGGAGLDGLDRGLADAGGRVQDLSAGFVELTQAASGFEAQGGSLVELLVRSNALFGEQSGLLGQLTAQAPVLGGELAALFEESSEAGRVFAEVSDAVGASLLDAFEGAIERGESLSDVLKGLALDMAEIALKAAGNALLESILGGLLGGLGGGIGGGRAASAGTSIPGGIGGFAKGAAFASDSVMARNLKEFARGGIVDTPEAFAFAHGLGIMGEAGPEAILPLARARSGELGVRAMIGRQPAAQAPAPAGPTFNIFAPGADREGFREIMALIIKLDGKVDQVSRSMPGVAIRAWANHRRRGGFR